jgi:hypothetical protein
MTRIGLRCAIAAVAMLASFSIGSAQPPEKQDDRRLPPATRTLNLTLEQRHVIRELVKDLKVDRATIDTKVSAGDQVPSQVAVHPIPPLIGQKVPQIKSHRFYITEAQIVIVDPQEPRVVEVIE